MRPGAYPTGYNLKDAPDLLENIVLGWNGLPGTNALAYLASSSATEKKKFYDIGNWNCQLRKFFPSSFRPIKYQSLSSHVSLRQ